MALKLKWWHFKWRFCALLSFFFSFSFSFGGAAHSMTDFDWVFCCFDFFGGEYRSSPKKCVFLLYDFYCFMNSLMPHTRPNVECWCAAFFSLFHSCWKLKWRHDSHPEINRCNIDNKKIYSFSVVVNSALICSTTWIFILPIRNWLVASLTNQ